MPATIKALAVACALSLLGWSAPAQSGDDAWSQSYNAASQLRYIPLELILGAPWDGKKEIALPKGYFTEGVARDPSTWRGPSQWQHPQTSEKLMVYDRSRRGVWQKFAVRTDGSAIGRVADSRFDINSCDQEAKYPLGYWTQSEVRQFEYRCWYGSKTNLIPVEMVTTLTIEEIDFDYHGSPHSLQVRWVLRRKNDAREIDNRTYIFSPGKGAVSVR
jgi:hypothetical protein